MTTLYSEDIERKFIDDYYFDCEKKYKREKLCNLRTNLAEGKCPKAETTIRAYCMWLYAPSSTFNMINFNLYETYSHKFYGKTIPKCFKQIDRKQKKKKPDDFILIEEEREEIKVPEKKLSPEKPKKTSLNDAMGLTELRRKETEAYKKKMNKLKEERDKKKLEKKLSPEKPPVQEKVKEEEDFHFQEDIVKTNDDWDPLKGEDYINYYKAKDKIEGWIADKQDWRIKTTAWTQMFKNPTLFSKNCIKGYVRCILKQI